MRAVAILALVFTFAALGVRANVLRCAHEGFRSTSTRKALTSLLDADKDNRSVTDAYVMTESIALYDNGRLSSQCDVMFVNVPATLLMLNEHASIETLQSAYQSMLAHDSVKKKDIVVFISGTEEDIGKSELNLRKLLAEAWILLEKPEFVSDNVEEECNIRIVALIKNEEEKAKKVVQDTVNQIISSGAGVPSSDFMETLQEITSGGAVRMTKSPPANYRGYEICEIAKVKALMWAQDAAQASATRLQKQERAGEFTGFMDNLVTKAEEIYKEGTVDTGEQSLSPFHTKRGLTEVKSQIYAMLLPFFRRHVQLARVESAKSFNAKAGDDLAITTDIMTDLERIRDDTMREFKKACDALQPAGAPSTWTYEFDVKQLRMSLDEYLESREAQAKLVGVLPRGRKPVDVSIHYFANHPLGKDYRQDALTLSDKDVVMYDAGVAKARTPSIHPSLARAKLKRKEKSNSFSMLESRRIKGDSEFAREMLMFPLSIKNPDVPLSAGRAKKPSSIEAARKRAEGLHLGPHRLVDWNVDPTMQEAKRALDKAVSGKSSEQQSEVKNRIFNTIPLFRKGFYKHPPLNYDK